MYTVNYSPEYVPLSCCRYILKKQQTTSSTPRSGVKRENEERKKELNRMREDARAQRAQEAVSKICLLSLYDLKSPQKKTFDLQGQMEKSLRFEEKLRLSCPAVLYPNILAARWKEEYEREKKRQKLEP